MLTFSLKNRTPVRYNNVEFLEKLQKSSIVKILDPVMITVFNRKSQFDPSVAENMQQVMVNLLQRYPQSQDALPANHAQICRTLCRQNEFAEAEKALTHLLSYEINGHDRGIILPLLTYMSHVYERLGKFDDAIQCHSAVFLVLGSRVQYDLSSMLDYSMEILLHIARLKRKSGDYAAYIALLADAGELSKTLRGKARITDQLARIASPTYMFDFAIDHDWFKRLFAS